MAAPADKTLRATAPERDSELAEVRVQLNNLIAAVRNIATKLDAEALAASDYFATSCDAALGAAAPTKVQVKT